MTLSSVMRSSETETKSFIEMEDNADVRVLGLFSDMHSTGRFTVVCHLRHLGNWNTFFKVFCCEPLKMD